MPPPETKKKQELAEEFGHKAQDAISAVCIFHDYMKKYDLAMYEESYDYIATFVTDLEFMSHEAHERKKNT